MTIAAKVRAIPNAHAINRALSEVNTQVNQNTSDIAGISTSTYLSGITPGTAAASKAVVLDASSKIDTLDITSLDLNGTTVDATDVLAGVTAGTSAASKAVVLDASSQIDALDIIKHTITNGTPVNAVAASGTLTISGVVIDGETVTCGADVYEFAADDAQTVTGSNIAVDITSYADKAQGTLTVDTQPTSGEVFVLGAKTYTFVPLGTANADGEVDIGADVAAAKVNIVAAINGSDGYNVASTVATAATFAANDCVVTALIGGTAGNSIVSTTTMAGGTNAWDAGTLGTTTAGTDCSAPNAVTALVAAEVASGTEDVTFSDGAGDTVDIDANTKGVLANSIATTENMANGSFAAGTLTGGIDGTLGSQWEVRIDASYLYAAVADNTIADNNWRRVSLGTAY